MASISTPVLPTQAVVQIAVILLVFSSSSNSTSHFVMAIGWQSGISIELFFAPMIPAILATPSTSPFLAVPVDTALYTASFTFIVPQAFATR